jgi:hypothetical protein
MTLELCFWILMLLMAVFGVAPAFRAGERSWSGMCISFLPWLALLVLGWATFGAPIHG